MSARSPHFNLELLAAERFDKCGPPILSPFVEVMVRQAGMRPGLSVLDLACGTGLTARTVVELVEPNGHVTAVDLNPTVLQVAADRDSRIDWVHAPAEDLPFADSHFDVVMCQQGMQFFNDLAKALDEAVRVLKPGGSLVSTSWTSHNRSPYMAAQFSAIQDEISANGVDAFMRAFSMQSNQLLEAAVGAGLADVAVEEVALEIELPPLPDYAELHLSALPWGAALARDNPSKLATLAEDVTQKMSAWRRPNGGAVVPFSVWLLTARRP